MSKEITIPQRLTKKELKHQYKVSYQTLSNWLSRIKDLGKPEFGQLGYSRRQIIMIYRHLGPPE